jgi:hypothetical protein
VNFDFVREKLKPFYSETGPAVLAETKPAASPLKGGVAMELRFAEGARATKDIDIGLTGERAERLRAFGALRHRDSLMQTASTYAQRI